MTQFRLVRQSSGTVDGDLFDVDPIRDAFGMFASGTTAKVVDRDGTKIDDYPYGQRVEVQVSTDGGSTWSVQQAGLVIDATRSTKNGLPHVNLDIVKYDHLLRRRKVYKTYSSTTRSSILEDLIKNFTSVNWVAGNVTVVNDDSVDLPLRGVRVDEAINKISGNSADEEFGVNNSLEFFFREQDTSRAPPIEDKDVIDYDLPQEGKRAINRFKLFYGSNGDSFVTVEDRQRQQDLKDKLNAPRRVVISDSDTFTEITTEAVAERVAREQLGTKSVIQTGTLQTPLGRFDTESGDVVELTIGDAGISAVDFRIAQIDHEWQNARTVYTVAENVGANIDSLLKNLSDSLSNVRSRAADPAATGTRYLDQKGGVELSITATVETRSLGDGFILGQSQLGQGTGDKLGGQISGTTSVSLDSSALTRVMLNMARDVWQGESFTDITHFAVGDNDSAATRADNALSNELDRVEISKYGAGNSTDKFEFLADVNPGGALADSNDVEEFGFFDAATGGNCYFRATIPATTIDSDTGLTVHIEATVSNNSDRQGVITNTGQERLVDLLIGETGHEPSDMVYGTDTTSETVSDSSLGSQVHEDGIDSRTDKTTGVTTIVERIASGEANGNDLAELGYENSANELLSRLTFEALSKTSLFALETDYKFQAENA